MVYSSSKSDSCSTCIRRTASTEIATARLAPFGLVNFTLINIEMKLPIDLEGILDFRTQMEAELTNCMGKLSRPAVK
jgi:hypothetical protein